MSPQLSLVYRPGMVGGEQWLVELEALRAAVNYLGLKEVAFELDISGSSLSDAINARDRKRWAGEWTHVIHAMLVARREDIADDLSKNLVDAQMGLTHYLPSERRKLSPEELAFEFERELRDMGETGKKAIARVMRRTR
jgi:hypothetical protein